MADEIALPRLRAVGTSQGQTPPVLQPFWTQTNATIPAAGFGVAFAQTTVTMPNRGAIWVPDHLSAGVGNGATANLTAGQLIGAFVQVLSQTITLRNWLATFNQFGLVGGAASALQVETFEEIDALEAATVGGLQGGINPLNFTFFAIINNNTAGSLSYGVSPVMKYHFKLQQQ